MWLAAPGGSLHRDRCYLLEVEKPALSGALRWPRTVERVNCWLFADYFPGLSDDRCKGNNGCHEGNE